MDRGRSICASYACAESMRGRDSSQQEQFASTVNAADNAFNGLELAPLRMQRPGPDLRKLAVQNGQVFRRAVIFPSKRKLPIWPCSKNLFEVEVPLVERTLTSLIGTGSGEVISFR